MLFEVFAAPSVVADLFCDRGSLGDLGVVGGVFEFFGVGIKEEAGLDCTVDFVPPSATMGTSTCGLRIPPRALPDESRAYATDVSRRSATTVPSTSAVSATSFTTVAPPSATRGR